YRCKKASELISEGLSVSEAALKCGFSNMSFFTRTFREYIGCLPSKFNKNIF
ncbi:MAG: AraC family transcriptional regulator, partial [Clostridia bacterium]|nr:AraC family transcriptional regulator [Clostridia bacterium]